MKMVARIHNPPGEGRWASWPRTPAAPSGCSKHGSTFATPIRCDRLSKAVPPAHGTYRGLDLELLDRGEEDERAVLIEARHREFADALQGDDHVMLGGEPVNPRLHVAMHQVVANQLPADGCGCCRGLAIRVGSAIPL